MYIPKFHDALYGLIYTYNLDVLLIFLNVNIKKKVNSISEIK